MQLGGHAAGQVAPELVELMATEPDAFVRETLTWAVVQDRAAAAPALVAALGRHDLPHEPVLHALSKVGDPATVPAILPHAASEDPVVAAKAWWALGRIADESSLPVLLAALGAEQAQLRHSLTRALLQFGARAIDALERELDHPDAAHRSHAAEVLVAFASPDQYGTAERRSGKDFSARAADVLRRATAPEVDGALLLATVSDDRPGLSGAAGALRESAADTLFTAPRADAAPAGASHHVAQRPAAHREDQQAQEHHDADEGALGLARRLVLGLVALDVEVVGDAARVHCWRAHAIPPSRVRSVTRPRARMAKITVMKPV